MWKCTELKRENFPAPLQGSVSVPPPTVLPTSLYPLTTSSCLWSRAPLSAAARQDTPHPVKDRKKSWSKPQTWDLHSHSLQQPLFSKKAKMFKVATYSWYNSGRVLIRLKQSHFFSRNVKKKTKNFFGASQICEDLSSWQQFVGASLDGLAHTPSEHRPDRHLMAELVVGLVAALINHMQIKNLVSPVFSELSSTHTNAKSGSVRKDQQRWGQCDCQNVLMSSGGLTQLLDKFCERNICM